MFCIYLANNQVAFWVYSGELGLISTDDNENDLEDKVYMLDIYVNSVMAGQILNTHVVFSICFP